MIKIVDGKRYNTEASREIWSRAPMGHDRGSFHWYEETLFQSLKGQWFLYAIGNACSPYGVRTSQNSHDTGDVIIPMKPSEALAWLEKNAPAAVTEAEFSEIEEA